MILEHVLQRSLSQVPQGPHYDEMLARALISNGISPASLNMRNFPLFQIKYTPRSRCKVHHATHEK